MLYCTVVYYTIQYYTMLYYTILYCTVLYQAKSQEERPQGRALVREDRGPALV